MNTRISEIKKQIEELQIELHKEEHKEKKKKGILKEGEWYLLSVFELDENDKVVGEPDNIVFYRTLSQSVCLNAYFEWYSGYVHDLLTEEPYYQKWKGRKINKEEALKYL